ncbi:MAG TPA: hypothetical protein VFI54_03795 [Solirubrobacteraceae bacterium]|nr:hypothetical protein [Solirubrobacteraceae bacterium]
MRINVKVGTLCAAASALAIAVPAAAHPGTSEHPHNSGHSSGANHPSQSHKCTAHSVAYLESGTVDSATGSTLAVNPDGTWSGTLVVDVTRANHWAKANRGTTVTYPFSNAKLTVRFDGGTNGFAAGERVKLIGKLGAVSKKCATLTPAPSPTFRAVVVHPATS